MTRSDKIVPFDVLVIGSGPAGLTMAVDCARRGLRVGCLDRDFDAPWTNQYGAWCDEWDLTPYSDCLSHRWEDSRFASNTGEVSLNRTYGRIDRVQLKARLLAELDSFGGTCISALASGITRDKGESFVAIEDGTRIQAALVIDACGFSPLRDGQNTEDHAIGADSSTAWQTAWGELIRVRQAPKSLRTAFYLMDFRSPESATESWLRRPSFLYSMPLDADHIFVEETSLAGIPELPMETLRHRLQLRLDWMEVEVLETLEVERCRIPMNLPMSRPQSACLRWGAAAGMIHPATGFMVCGMVRRSPGVAKAIADELSGGQPLTDAGLRRLYDAVWPTHLRKARDLHLFGLNEVLTMELDELSEFFGSFFDLPDHHWRCYLDTTSSHREITAAMFRLFLSASPHLKARLVKAGFRRPITLLTSL